MLCHHPEEDQEAADLEAVLVAGALVEAPAAEVFVADTRPEDFTHRTTITIITTGLSMAFIVPIAYMDTAVYTAVE